MLYKTAQSKMKKKPKRRVTLKTVCTHAEDDSGEELTDSAQSAHTQDVSRRSSLRVHGLRK